MIDKRFSKAWTIGALIWLALFIPTFAFFHGRNLSKERVKRSMQVHEQVLKDRAEAKAEALRRNAEKSDHSPDPNVRVAPTFPPTFPRNRPTREMAEQHPGEGLSPSVEVMDGLEAAQAAERQHALATLAAAKKRREWELRRDALRERVRANSERIGTSVEATLASGDAELKLILSLFKGLSPEQLEYAREEALKTLPAEKVEAFFDDLANHGTTTTLEQLTRDAQDILKSREARDITRREIRVERQLIELEEEELKRTEPPIPW